MAEIYGKMEMIVVLKKTMKRGIKSILCFGCVSVELGEEMFSCQHFEIITDLWFQSVYYDGWVIIATFLWIQSRHLLDILL